MGPADTDEITLTTMELKVMLSARSASVHVSISWLWKFLVLDHLLLDADQDLLHGVSRVPVFEHGEFVWINLSVSLVDERKVNFGVELNLWSLSWVVLSASDVHHVNSVVEVGVLWTNNCTVPVCETFIIT